MRIRCIHSARRTVATCICLLAAAAAVQQVRASQPENLGSSTPPVRFNRDVRPILADKCFACHGPDAETLEADLRLDQSESVGPDRGILVPGAPAESELIRRILSEDVDEVMPPPETHKPLSSVERETLKRWVEQGATYEAHWSYTPTRQTSAPDETIRKSELIDHFIDQRLKELGVKQAEPADKITLLRRLSFDLTGLPPSIAEVEAFLSDASVEAYSKLVARLLASPRFGERMAVYWLDLVRYADTVGYHGDQNVSQFPYRDYVINAFNRNLPYDQFVREQLAGDLLPGATTEQLIASGYNRLNQTTEEGGSQAKEYLAIYFADRVRNVSQVFMGSTLGCAQCHDHKYDPFTTQDFYSLGAFFADLDEKGVYSARSREPMLHLFTESEQQRLAQIDEKSAQLERSLTELYEQLAVQQPRWEREARQRLRDDQPVDSVWLDDHLHADDQVVGDLNQTKATDGPVHSGALSRRQASDGLVQHYVIGSGRKIRVQEDTRLFCWVYLDPADPPQAVMLQLHSDNWNHRAVWGSDAIDYGRRQDSWAGYRRQGELPTSGTWTRLEVTAKALGLKPGAEIDGFAFTQFAGLAYWDQAGWLSPFSLAPELATILAKPESERSQAEAKQLREHYLASDSEGVAIKRAIEDQRAQRQAIEDSAVQTVVSRSVEPRTIRVLPRGNWMDDSGEIVTPAVPEFLGKVKVEGRRANRLDLADWLCSPENPLTARTLVNRLWGIMFGRGICTSVDDLGGQGSFPSYPRLLDALAVELVDSGWDIKHILRLMAMSDAYRRSSVPTQQQLEIDPSNDLFARQGRFRLDAEMVRDLALSVSGLLHEEIGGPSAKPYQPEGYYAQLNFPRRTYKADDGANQYRRGVYTHWQRTFLHPMLKAFDAPSREECTALRARSSTPLQSLALLNDPTFVEAAGALGRRIASQAGTPHDKITWGYQMVVSHRPSAQVSKVLLELYQQQYAFYRQHKAEAEQLLSVGQATSAGVRQPAKVAAWTSVSRALLNLHESIMRY